LGLGAIWQMAVDGTYRLLSYLYQLTGSYGLAIVALTLLFRLVLHPLSHKQNESMQKMQRLQPRIRTIQQKYAGDRQKMNEEIMRLYREYGVNPAAGCLPLLAQLPLLILLFRVLMTFDFGGASFLGVPLQRSPLQVFASAFGLDPSEAGFFVVLHALLTRPLGFLRVLEYGPTALLVGAIAFTMWYQQKITSAGNPQAAFMNLFMPAFLTFVCLSLPGGVLVYWLVSSVVGVLQQLYAVRKASSLEGKPVVYRDRPPSAREGEEDRG